MSYSKNFWKANYTSTHEDEKHEKIKIKHSYTTRLARIKVRAVGETACFIL